jgi:hypothetical protein
MRKSIVLILLAACTQNGDQKDFYDSVERGSTWQLTITDGAHVDEEYGGGYYTGACPAFAARAARVPDDGNTMCEPGCTCSFDFSLSDTGDVGHDYSTDAGFSERCSDGSSLMCVSPDPEHGETGLCTWLSGKIDPSVDPFGDCQYTFVIEQTN